MRYAVATMSYGRVPPHHAGLIRQLREAQTTIFTIRSAPYPEFARAEHVRQALASPGLDVLVWLDSSVKVTREELDELAQAALHAGTAVSPFSPPTLALCAVPMSSIRRMVQSEPRSYDNSCVELSKEQGIPSAPIASPWNPDGSPLLAGAYLNDEEAVLERLRRIGSDVTTVALSSLSRTAPARWERSANLDRPLTSEPGSRFALCIPHIGGIDTDQLQSVLTLERAGMAVIEYSGSTHIDQVRSYLAERALESGRGVFFVDHDILFHPNDVLRLCDAALKRNAVVAAAYCMRTTAKNIIGAIDQPPGPITFFKGGKILPAYYTGLGFAAIPPDVLTTMPLTPLWSTEFKRRLRPWFALECGRGLYCGEDVSFAHRVHGLDVSMLHDGPADDPGWLLTRGDGEPARMFLDTTIRIAHRGTYDYMIEDAGIAVPCCETVEATLTPSRNEARALLVNAQELPVDMRLNAIAGYADPSAVVRP